MMCALYGHGTAVHPRTMQISVTASNKEYEQYGDSRPQKHSLQALVMRCGARLSLNALGVQET